MFASKMFTVAVDVACSDQMGRKWEVTQHLVVHAMAQAVIVILKDGAVELQSDI